MIIDFHTHIFPSEICTNREKFFYKENSFELLYNLPKSRLHGVKQIIDSMDEYGIDISVVFGFPWKNEDNFKRHNDYILDSAAKYPDRLIGFCCVDPNNRNAASEVMRCIENGMSGVGELSFYSSGIDDESLVSLKPIMQICIEKALPVLIHTNEPVGHLYPGKTPINLKQIHNLIKCFKKNKIVLAHWGGGLFFYNLLKKELKADLENVYFDTAASPFLYDLQIYSIASKIIGNNKILFGSDFPLLNQKRYFEEINNADLSKEEKENICCNNAAILLKLNR